MKLGLKGANSRMVKTQEDNKGAKTAGAPPCRSDPVSIKLIRDNIASLYVILMSM